MGYMGFYYGEKIYRDAFEQMKQCILEDVLQVETGKREATSISFSDFMEGA